MTTQASLPSNLKSAPSSNKFIPKNVGGSDLMRASLSNKFIPKNVGGSDLMRASLSNKPIPNKKQKSAPLTNLSSSISFSKVPFPLIQNSETNRWIYHFITNKNISYIKLWLRRSYRYFPYMKSRLQQAGLPKELAYMTLIESGLSSQATSSANAVGYWQFIQPTALRFGLRVNNWIDERRDFEKSTLAATRYLSFLYEEFQDWLLVMAAYNMGEDNLKRWIKTYGSQDFWVLSKKRNFPRETANYVPKILAASIIMKNPERYGFNQFKILTPYVYDVFYVPGGSNLHKLCLETSLPCSQVKILNPALKGWKIPKSIPHHLIRIPEGHGLALSKWLKKNQL